MTRHIRSTWLSHKEMRIFCIDCSGQGTDVDGLEREIQACKAQLTRRGEGRLLVTVDLHQTVFGKEVTAFINQCSASPDAPFRKIAILGISKWQRFWYARSKHVTWPKCARFFNGYDPAKDWLVSERD
ncbi:MAG TPA: hypothetical protein VGJ97_08675 [Anaerolineaceae bacterium]|jgi:hypothetical protein